MGSSIEPPGWLNIDNSPEMESEALILLSFVTAGLPVFKFTPELEVRMVVDRNRHLKWTEPWYQQGLCISPKWLQDLLVPKFWNSWFGQFLTLFLFFSGG